jgi:hypothetical protein
MIGQMRRKTEEEGQKSNSHWTIPAERARRIWLWWRIPTWDSQEFQFIPLALRLVALVQPSSGGIERVFSQLKLILDACGDSVLESTLQCRLFERCGCTGFHFTLNYINNNYCVAVSLKFLITHYKTGKTAKT